MVKKSFKITCETGIHARPATTLVNVVMGFKSDVTLSALKKEVDFKSIMGVMSLGIYSGTVVEVKAEGEDEEEAVKAIADKIIALGLGKEI
jgi:phosphocarrier protein